VIDIDRVEQAVKAAIARVDGALAH
jgi:hypothetical protein